MPDAQEQAAPPFFDGGGSDITIAVIDGQVLTTHPSLEGARLEMLAAAGSATSAATQEGLRHGTAIASLLFGQPDSETTGLAWRCRGLLRPIYRDGPDGLLPASQDDLAAAIREVVAAGADIINISGGELAGTNDLSPALAEALAQAEAADVLVVAATGNDGCDCAHFPAAVPSVLAVGAVDIDGAPLSSSNWGSHYQTHGIVAQGDGLAAAAPEGGIIRPQGTSMATAVVSGAAALLMAAGKRAGKTFGAAAIRDALIAGAQPVNGPDGHKFLAGRIDLANALARLLRPVPSLQSKAEVIMTEIVLSDAITGDPLSPAALAVLPAAITASLPPLTVAASDRMPGITPSAGDDCPTCVRGSNAGDGKPVYVLGMLSYDLGSETRRQSLLTSLDAKALFDPAALLKELKKPANAYLAEAITWTLTIDEVPVYVIRPAGAFAAEGYRLLLDLLDDQINDGAERISVPGILNGHSALPSGLILPVVQPELRGMYSWTTSALTKSLLTSVAAGDVDAQMNVIANFLERVYFEIRNLGQASDERALNFASTQAFQFGKVFESALRNSLQLDSIHVEKSPIARPGSDSWDVKLLFFNPLQRMNEARMIYRFTVDVSDVIPVMVGPMRQWRAY